MDKTFQVRLKEQWLRQPRVRVFEPKAILERRHILLLEGVLFHKLCHFLTGNVFLSSLLFGDLDSSSFVDELFVERSVFLELNFVQESLWVKFRLVVRNPFFEVGVTPSGFRPIESVLNLMRRKLKVRLPVIYGLYPGQPTAWCCTLPHRLL